MMRVIAVLAACWFVVLAQGGPDQGGYRWIDSDTTAGPVFDWYDISGSGTRVELGDDDNKGPFALGFAFRYYGVERDSIRICSNGWLSFSSASHQFHHYRIPDTRDPNALLAVLWADLDPTAGGDVYYLADTAGQRFIVSWIGVPFHGTDDSCTFQVVLDSGGGVRFQYLDLPGVEGTDSWIGEIATPRRHLSLRRSNATAATSPPRLATTFPGSGCDSCSVGIENDTGNTGLEYLFEGEPGENRLHDSLAIRFYQLERDVCPVALLRPFDLELAGADVVPVVQVWNPGLSLASFPVRLSIGAGYSEEISVADLGPLADTLLEFPAWFPGADTYDAEVATGLAGDEFPGNDTLRCQVVTAFRGDLRYDDGGQDTWFLRVGAPTHDWAALVRFSSPYGQYQLLGAKVYLRDTLPFARVLACPDSAGAPGLSTPLFEAESVAALEPESWVEVQVDTVLTAEELWLVAFWPRGAQGPAIGEDQDVPIDERSWFGSPTVRWIEHDDGDLMMRLMVDGGTGIEELEPQRVCGLRVEPNPCRGRLLVRLSGLNAGAVRIVVRDVAGRVVREAVRATRGGAIDWVWAGTGCSGRPVQSGAYFIEAVSGKASLRHKVLLVR